MMNRGSLIRSVRRMFATGATAVLTVAALSVSNAPAQVFQTITILAKPEAPADKVVELLRREAEAKKAEREGMFAQIDAIDKKPATPDVAARGAMEAFMKNAQPKAAPAGRAAPAVAPPAVAVKAIRLMPAMPAAAVPAQIAMQQQAQQVAMVQQWSTQMRPMLKMEYQYIRIVCDPPKEKRKPIAHDGEVALHEAAVKFVDWQFGRNAFGPNGVRRSQPDSRKIIRDALVASAKANLSEELYQRYRKEIEARDEESKQGAILSLVTKLDAQLILSAEQREKISKGLSESWDDNWSYQQAYFNVDYAYFPLIPDKAIVPFLNDAQKKVWSGTQKVMIGNNGINGMLQDAGPLDDEFADDPVKIEAKPEEKVAVPAPVMPGAAPRAKMAVPAPALAPAKK